MNEQIRLLAEQARKYARDYVADCKHYGHYMEHNELEVKFEEKFAELLVKECAMIVEGFEITQEVALDEYVDFEASAVLKEHFGVEE